MVHGESDHLRVLRGRESRPQGVTVRRSPHRKLVPDMSGRSTQANLPEGNSLLLGHRDCGSESHRGARCGKTARRDLGGGRRVTGVPTATAARPFPLRDMMMTTQEASATLLKAVDTLEPLIRQHADEAERHRRLALPVVRALTDAGLFRMCVPLALEPLQPILLW